jgi:hypothetical protein
LSWRDSARRYAETRRSANGTPSAAQVVSVDGGMRKVAQLHNVSRALFPTLAPWVKTFGHDVNVALSFAHYPDRW